jgi:hypothetical protein
MWRGAFGKKPANSEWNHNPDKHTASIDVRVDADGGRTRNPRGVR